MPGVTKHIFDHDIRDIVSMWNEQLKSIQRILPEDYTGKDIISLLKKYYPHEWSSVEIKYIYYQSKDKYLKKRFRKDRYHMKKPEELLCSVSMYKKIMSFDYQKKYFESFSKEEIDRKEVELWNKRKLKIEKVDNKIEKFLYFLRILWIRFGVNMN